MTTRDEAIRLAGQHIAEALMLIGTSLVGDQQPVQLPTAPAATKVYLTTTEVAERFRTTPDVVRTWRHRETGPKGTRFGKRVLYSVADVEAWEQQETGDEPVLAGVR